MSKILNFNFVFSLVHTAKFVYILLEEPGNAADSVFPFSQNRNLVLGKLYFKRFATFNFNRHKHLLCQTIREVRCWFIFFFINIYLSQWILHNLMKIVSQTNPKINK